MGVTFIQDVSSRLALCDHNGRIVVTRAGETAFVAGQPYWIAGRYLTTEGVYWVEGVKPRGDGGWTGEADKIIWMDEASRYRCMILRRPGGNLSGLVGLDPDHPLYAIGHEDLRSSLEGGLTCPLTYSGLGEGGEGSINLSVEARIVRDVIAPTHFRPVTFTPPTRSRRDDKWWIGFDGTAASDSVSPPGAQAVLELPTPESEYVDEAAIYLEVVRLATSLRRLAALGRESRA